MIFKYIYAREDVVDMRSIKIPAIIMGINLIFLSILYFFFQRLGRKEDIDVAGQTDYYRLIFSLLLILEYMLLVFVSPYFTSKSISIERERSELDFLLMSNLSAWDIVLGKYIYALSNLFLIMFSALPFMILSWIYARADGIDIFKIWFFAMCSLAALNAIFMLISVCTKRVYIAMFTSYIIILLLLFLASILWIRTGLSVYSIPWESFGSVRGSLLLLLCTLLFTGGILLLSAYILMPLKRRF